MNGPEHYRHAEELLGATSDLPVGADVAAELVAKAQVHATLALVAATVHDRVSDRVSGSWNEALS